MRHYIAKKIMDANENIIGYEVPNRCSRNYVPPPGHTRFISGDDFKYSMLVKVGEKWEIQEDTSTKSTQEAKELNRLALKDRVNGIKKSDLSNASQRTDLLMDLIELVKG
jgi:hypothetical protein